MRAIPRLTLTVSALVLVLMPVTAGAAIINQTYSGSYPGTVSGTLTNEGSALELALTLPSAGTLTAYTTSYATNGFEPNLTLYNSAGMFVASQGATPPPGAAADPTTRATLDGYLSASGLLAGHYTLTLTDWELGQSITATNLSDGFTQNIGNGTTFIDVNGNTRTGNYVLDLAFTAAATATPEPSTWLLMAPLLVSGLLLRRKRTLEN